MVGRLSVAHDAANMVVEEELTNRDSFDAASDYDRGMRDAYRWVRNKLRSLPEIPVIRKGEIIYERMG